MNTKQTKFIQLRADGISFDKIAKEINTSKPTLIQWSRLFKEDIEDMQFQAMNDLKQSYNYNKKARYEQYLKQLDKFNKAIDNVDLTGASVKDLLQVRNDINYKLEMMESSTIYTNTNIVQTCEFTQDKTNITVKLNEM